MSARPIVKWAGGKTRLLPELVARIPRAFGRYYEPFAGGAALFFHLTPAPATLGDSNPDLVTTYTAVRDDFEGVLALLAYHKSVNSLEHFTKVRDNFNDVDRRYWRPRQRAAAFIYLNKTCFNGLWRVNRDGKFNVPYGKYDNPNVCDAETLEAAHTVLQGVDVWEGSYLNTCHGVRPGDFVYFDPPYVPASKTSSFTAYASEGFDENDQRALAAHALELARRGVQVMLSNSDTPLVRELYAGCRIDSVECARAINSRGSGRGPVPEVIVTAGYDFENTPPAPRVVPA